MGDVHRPMRAFVSFDGILVIPMGSDTCQSNF